MTEIRTSCEDSNPLLQQFYFPPFDLIEPKHVRPGISTLLNQLERELQDLESTVEPTWPKLVEPLERIHDRLMVVWGAVNYLSYVNGSSELQGAVDEMEPHKVAFELRLCQSKPIYRAFKAIQGSLDWNSLDDARKRVVETMIKRAILSGIAIEDDKRYQLNKIQQELVKLSHKFEKNVLDASKEFEILVTDKAEIDGLPTTALEFFAKTALSQGYPNITVENGPWLIIVNDPSLTLVMKHARNRTFREDFYCIYATGTPSKDVDNTPVIDQILKLRLEKAKLLGYNNYAELSMATKMATVDKARELLDKLRILSWNAAVQEMEDLQQFCKSQGLPEADNLSHWDITYWSEMLRESTCVTEASKNINQIQTLISVQTLHKVKLLREELRPYFSLPNVIDGLFKIAKKLFGITIEAADGLAPVWNNDVQFYSVVDSSGSPLAYLYLDPYSRPSKKCGGAWMQEVVGRRCVLSQDGISPRLPIASLTCDLTPPVVGKPSFMTFDEVEMVFHEFGHALQHMLTEQDEGFVSGLRGIEDDALELASQFMENWCNHRETFMSIAKHYETGDNLPEKLYKKLLADRNFRAGSLSLSQLRLGAVDLELHMTYDPGGSEFIFDIYRRISERYQVLPPLPDDRFLCGFNHIFGNSYAAGYYGYKWAEVLSSDAFSAFEDADLNDEKALQETGLRFRETILGLGGRKSTQEVFMVFRGREPSLEALLRHNGFFAHHEA